MTIPETKTFNNYSYSVVKEFQSETIAVLSLCGSAQTDPFFPLFVV